MKLSKEQIEKRLTQYRNLRDSAFARRKVNAPLISNVKRRIQWLEAMKPTAPLVSNSKPRVSLRRIGFGWMRQREDWQSGRSGKRRIGKNTAPTASGIRRLFPFLKF